MAKSSSKRVLTGYVGVLSDAEIAEGMNAAIGNAGRLASDAKLLLDANRYPSAASIAILSIEEAGKVSILRRLVTANSGEEAKKIWNDYRNHWAKNTLSIFPALVAKGAQHLRDFAEAVDKNNSHTAELDAVKQIGFYTDCYEKQHWSIPSEIIEADLATHLVKTAELLSEKSEVSPRELELWREIMGPVWETAAMPDALTRWHEAMIKEGLSSHSRETFSRFIFGPNS